MHEPLLRAFHAVMDVAAVVLLSSDGRVLAHDVHAAGEDGASDATQRRSAWELAESIAQRAVIAVGESAFVLSELGRVLVVRTPTAFSAASEPVAA